MRVPSRLTAVKPELSIPTTGQKDRRLWGRECPVPLVPLPYLESSFLTAHDLTKRTLVKRNEDPGYEGAQSGKSFLALWNRPKLVQQTLGKHMIRLQALDRS